MFDINCQDTIVAVATPPGEGGVAIVRLSGTRSQALLANHFQGKQPPFESHHFYYGHFIDSHGEKIDEVMVVFMQAPRSFTAENVVEIHCHGSRIVQKSILNQLQQSGARLAEPGEFTFRAFIHGRIDLTQAEGVVELIHARSDRARKVALEQLEGRLGHSLLSLQKQISDLLALVECWIDFTDEAISPPGAPELQQQALDILRLLHQLIESYDSGRAYIEGVSVLLLGRPNVGKSSLLNTLIDEERAIVTDIPGTTRDVIEEGFTLEGLPLKLIDTAGLRQTEDTVEALGVERTRKKADQADLILLILDASQPLEASDKEALALVKGRRCLIVWNKIDLDGATKESPVDGIPVIPLSTKTKQGLEQLKQAVLQMFPLPSGNEGIESVVLTEQRHWQAARQAHAAVDSFYRQVAIGLPFELLAVDLREALDQLSSITGETTSDDILGRIFSQFCIGK